MNMDNFQQQSTNDTDTIALAIDFSSLYSAIRQDYEGNNISNIIKQLLHIYQPKDGINAYEYVLRKVQGFLEDCDFRKKQLLLSIIPSPNNIPDHTIKEVFRIITGFSKLNLQENSNTFQNIFDAKNMDGIMDNASSSKQNFLNDKSVSDFKSSLSEAFPFRGFSESEISMIPNHVKNADLSRHPLNNNPKIWLEKSNKYQMSSYQQYLLNKKYSVPGRINMYNTIGESYLCHSSQTGYQNAPSTKMCNKTEMIANLWQNKIPQQYNDVKNEDKKYEDAFYKDKKSGISHMIIDVGQDATIKQRIKNDIYKMDVCCDEDQNIIINADDLLPTVRDKLKTSLKNFLKRAQEGIFVELSAFPRTRSYPQQMGSLNTVYFTSEKLKARTPSKQDFTTNVSNNDSNSCLLLKQQNTNINIEKNQKESVGRIKEKAITYDNRLQKKYNSQKLNKVTGLPLQQNNLNYFDTEKKTVKFEYKQKATEESGHGCGMVESKSDDVTLVNNSQARSMFQLAAYKKRYYDTLLSVQKAKVAISNSLMSPSDHITAYHDPYYSNYMCQQQHLLHKQRHLMAGPQFLPCPTDLYGLSSDYRGVHCDQYSWARSICKYLLLKQLRLQRQTLPLYARNQSGWIHRYVDHMYPYSSIPNESDEIKYCVRRKNLEEIVGKLKETEHNNLD